MLAFIKYVRVPKIDLRIVRRERDRDLHSDQGHTCLTSDKIDLFGKRAFLESLSPSSCFLSYHLCLSFFQLVL